MHRRTPHPRLRAGRRLTVAALAVLLAAAGCGDEDGAAVTDPRALDRAAVAGVYDLRTLAFDPDGQLAETDVLQRFHSQDRPALFLGKQDDTFQLEFRDPASGLVERHEGRYDLLENGIRLRFNVGTSASRLLLPHPLLLQFDDESVTLAFQGGVSVPLHRVQELVPALAGEPLADPLPGTLRVLFGLNRR